MVTWPAWRVEKSATGLAHGTAGQHRDRRRRDLFWRSTGVGLQRRNQSCGRAECLTRRDYRAQHVKADSFNRLALRIGRRGLIVPFHPVYVAEHG